MRLCFTSRVLPRASNKFETRLIATASPIPVYSSGHGVSLAAAALETFTTAGCVSTHSPTSGLLTTSTVELSELRKRSHNRETSGVNAWEGGTELAAATQRLR